MTPARSEKDESCAAKHMKAAGVMIGLIITVVGFFVAYTMNTANAADVRLRTLEQRDATRDAEVVHIRQLLVEIRSDIKELRKQP